MSQLYLPTAHTDADLVLASEIAARIDSAALYVTWTSEHGQAAPEVTAELREPAYDRAGTLALMLGVVRELVRALLGRDDRRPEPGRSRALGPADAPQPRPAT